MSGSGTTAGTDASIPLQAGKGVQAPNPLQQIGQYALTGNLLNNLKAFPLQYQQMQQNVQSGQNTLTNQVNSSAYRAAAPLLALPSGQINHANVTSTLASIENNLNIPTHQIINDIADIAPGGDGPAFDAQVRALIASRSQTSPESAVGMVTQGTGPIINNGQSLQPTVAAPRGAPNSGQITPAGGQYPTYPSRTDLLTQQPGVGPNGEPISTNLANRAAEEGQPGLVGPTATGYPQPTQGQQPGYLPSANPSIGGPPGSPTDPMRRGAPNGVPPGYVATGLPLGAAQTAEASAQTYAQDQARASGYQADMLPLRTAYQTLQSGQAFTGFGSDTIQDIKSGANTFLRFFTANAPLSGSTAAYDEAKKYLTQVQMGQPGAGRSDAGLTTAGKGSPSTSISPGAAKLVLQNMIAMRQMQQDSLLAFQQSGLPSSQYQNFQTRWQTNADPRVYSYDMLTAPQRQALVQGMSDTQANRFAAQYQDAQKRGIIGDE